MADRPNCGGFSGYIDLIASSVTDFGCQAYARRKSFNLHLAIKSQAAGFALKQFARGYDIERELKELAANQRQDAHRHKAKPVFGALHEWISLQRQKVTNSLAIAKAMDYNLSPWEALTRFVDDGRYPWLKIGLRTRSDSSP